MRMARVNLVKAKLIIYLSQHCAILSNLLGQRSRIHPLNQENISLFSGYTFISPLWNNLTVC